MKMFVVNIESKPDAMPVMPYANLRFLLRGRIP